MLILIITDSFYFSGSQNIIVNFVKSKRLNQKYKFKFVIPKSQNYKRQFIKRIRGGNIDFVRVLMPACSHLGVYLSRRKIPIANKLIYLSAKLLQGFYIFLVYDIFKTWQLLRRYKPDIVYINNSGYPASDFCRATALSAAITSTKCYFHINNIAVSMEKTKWFKRPFEKFIDKVIGKYVFKFVLGSKYAGYMLSENRGISRDKITNVYNTCTDRAPTVGRNDLRKQHFIEENALIFGFVGAFEPRKGHKVLFDALMLLPQILKNRDVLFLVEGPLNGTEELMSYAKKNGLLDKVVFIGRFDNIFNFYNMIDILVLPSVCDEDFPNVIIEAMSLGIPTIGTKISGIPEAIKNECTGFLIEPENRKQLAAILEKNILNPEMCKSMKESCLRTFKEKFSYEIFESRCIELFEEGSNG